MLKELLLDLVVNVALYCAAASIVGRLMRRLDSFPRWQYDLSLGAVLGLTAVLGMLMPVNVTDGVVFDGRAIAVAAAGLFGGPLGAAASIIPPALYRLELGGAGALPAMINLALSGAIGVGVRLWARRAASEVRAPHLAVAALMLPFASYLAFPFFPTMDIAWLVFEKVGLTLAIVLPVGLGLLGLLLIDEQNRHALTVELRSNQRLFAALHADIPAMLFQRTLVDGKPKFSFISASSKRLLDRTPEELCRNPGEFIEAIHTDDRDAFLAIISAAERDGVMPTHEYRSVSRDGFVRWLRVSAAATMTDGGLVWNGVTIDVTRLKEAETRQNELAQIFHDSAVPIVRTDANFRIRYFNPAAERMYGYAADEVIGAPAVMFRPTDRMEAMGEFLSDLKENLRPGSIRTVSLHKNGKRIPSRLDLSPLLDNDGQLSGWAAMCLDMTEQQMAEDELERLATTDTLTLLPNRRSFEIRSASEVARARRYKRPLAVIMADIDHFKQVNDDYGHAIGDQALKATADVLAHTLRSSGDFAARLGGEEFAVLLPECDAEGAALLAERLRIGVATIKVDHPSGPITVRCSFGVSEIAHADTSIEPALGRADKALYASKNGGRDQVTVAPAPTAPVVIAASRGEPRKDRNVHYAGI